MHKMGPEFRDLFRGQPGSGDVRGFSRARDDNRVEAWFWFATERDHSDLKTSGDEPSGPTLDMDRVDPSQNCNTLFLRLWQKFSAIKVIAVVVNPTSGFSLRRISDSQSRPKNAIRVHLGKHKSIFHLTNRSIAPDVTANSWPVHKDLRRSLFFLDLRRSMGILGIMIETVNKTISDHDLIEDGQTILIGLSGGPDSVALLQVLSRLAEKRRWRLQAVYVNHGFRPRIARREEVFCQELADSLQVRLHIVREDVKALAKAKRIGLEEAGREFRYGVYEALADDEDCQQIALGHHADDRAETILFQMLRGAGRNGLIGMPIRRGRIIRPLFDCTKAEILRYLDQHKLAFCEDLSNGDPRFTRNYIRHRLLPRIRERINPAVDRALISMAETLSHEESFLTEQTQRVVKKVVRTRPTGKIELDLRSFNAYDTWLRRRLLRHCIARASGSHSGPDKATVRRIEKWLDGTARSISIPLGIELTRIEHQLVFHRRKQISFCHELAVRGRCLVSELAMTFRSRVASGSLEKISRRRQSRRVELDYDRIVGPLEVRSIRSGERFQPLGMNGTKTVADFLVDRKVPRVYRDETAVVCDQRGIIWLAGFEIADRVKISSATREVLSLEFTRHRK
jgi:tRNA(Ile)-lysidine synthase